MDSEHDVVAFAGAAVALRMVFQPDDETVDTATARFVPPPSAADFLDGKGPLPIAVVNEFKKWLSQSLEVVWTSRWSLRKVLLCGMAACRARHGVSSMCMTPNYVDEACRCLEDWVGRVSSGNVLAFLAGVCASASLSALVPVINGTAVVSRRGLRAATLSAICALAALHVPADPTQDEWVISDDSSPAQGAAAEAETAREVSRGPGIPDSVESVTLNHDFSMTERPRSAEDPTTFRLYRQFRSLRDGDTLGSGTYGTVVVRSCGGSSLCAMKEPRHDRKPAPLSPALVHAEAAVLVPAHVVLAQLGMLQEPPPVPRSRTYVWS